MAWTTPRDWSVGEVVTEAMMDTHIKDNLRYLKGLDGVITLSDSLILPDGAGKYLHIPILTTIQRDALTPTAGMIVYNSTTTQFNKYENAAWRADLGFNSAHTNLSGLTSGDDHTQYQKESLLTTAGDIAYATAASTWARLGIGTAGQYLRINAGVTAPEWASAVFANSFSIIASANLRNSNDTEKTTTATTYTKIKEVVLSDTYTSCRLKFTLDANGGTGGKVYARVYKNGGAIGTAQEIWWNAAPTEFSEDFSTWVAGDLIQVYAMKDAGDITNAAVSNMRLYYDVSIVNAVTNQDP